jgi:hypothetical protein
MGSKKFNASNISRSFPAIKKIIKNADSKENLAKIVKKLRGKDLDGVCDCAAIGLNALRRNNLKSDNFAKMTAHRDGLRFLARYAECPKEKKRSLRRKRDKTLVQSGQGLGVLLSILAPVIATALSKLIK